jgi:mRNA interferase MazF
MTMTQPNSSYKRGDVVLVLFPNSDLRSAKLHPALIVQTDNLEAGLSQTIVAMITSKMFRASHPSRVVVLRSSTEGRSSGLSSDSVILTDNLATVADTQINRAIGKLPMNQVDRALRHTLSL